MQEGQLIFRKKPPILSLMVLSLILIAFVYLLMVCELTFLELVLSGGVLALFAGMGLFVWKSAQNGLGFYEHGVVTFQQNQKVQFESYDTFSRVECYFTADEDGMYYCLEFFREDGTSVTLVQPNAKKLNQIWRKMLIHHPGLLQKLDCRSTFKFSAHLHQLLKKGLD